MRIITGCAKGKRLITPDGLDTRPTTDRVKEGLFSAINFYLYDANVLDLFAGSGQLGLESLSRGAKKCTFVDKDARALNAVKTNIANCGFADKSRVVNTEALTFLQSANEKFDIIFLDPPYERFKNSDLLSKVSEVLSDSGLVVCENNDESLLPDSTDYFKYCKKYRYGKIFVAVYKRKDDRD
ncbi:MAG: 16S rRNA (guanine(966)-N(2))-methyltransferase RsmD [Oscillospiraceae bacterium]|nr:16S rRNA (guanine(966)-N(2))-methyltransferase RsmD [Candidatus Equicaccousia limihippi]